MAEPLAVSNPQATRRARITTDEELYEADIVLGADGHPLLWNGFIAHPLFSRAEAERIANECNNNVGLDVENPRFVWVGDNLLQFDWDGDNFGPDSSDARYVRQVHQPDSHGRYAIGAWEWTWYEPEEATDGALG